MARTRKAGLPWNIKRILDNVVIDESTGCWNWIRAKANYGYGIVTVNHKNKRVHRISWELKNGAIPIGMHILHHCDNPPCCNPDHLFLGTHKDNMEDMARKGHTNRGQKNFSATLRDEDVLKIVASEFTQKQLAKYFSVDPSTISHIKTGKTWGWLTGRQMRSL